MPRSVEPNSAAVATAHPLATNAAREILLAGGNAIDAAVAALSVIGVVLSHQCGFGGFGGSMVLRSASTGRVVTLDFDSRAPLAYRDELYAPDPTVIASHGPLAVSVPAVVAGLGLALREFGTMPWSHVTQPAIELAEVGFEMDADTLRHLGKWRDSPHTGSLKSLFPDGRIPALGEQWVQPKLASLLHLLAKDGPDSFYHGEIPRRIVEPIRAAGGILSAEDFASYKPRLVDPLKISYRGHDIYTPPPPSGGVTMLQILKTLEQFDIPSMEKWGAPYLHLVAETAKLCWKDRANCLGDPDFVRMPIDELLSPAVAEAKAAAIRKDEIRRAKATTDLGPHTSNVSIIDRFGNLVSMTATQGLVFGSRVVIDDFGLVLNHGMSRFDFAPPHPNPHPNRPQPGKRMHHNMSPTIALRNGNPFAAVGLPGGTKIITVTAQLLVNLIDFRCSPSETIQAPRIHTDGGEPLGVSSSLPQSVVNDLTQLGHQVERGQTVGGPPTEIAGAANAVLIDQTAPPCAPSAASGGGPGAACVLTPVSG